MNTKNGNGTQSTDLSHDNDPFDEFEFKPLTEGLGFHPKAAQMPADRATTLKQGTTTKFTTEKRSASLGETNRSSTALNRVDFKTQGLTFETTDAGGPTGATTGAKEMASLLKSPLPRQSSSTSQSLPRRSIHTSIPMIEDDSIAQAQTAVNDLLKNLNHKKQQEEILAKSKKRLTWKDSTPSMVAAGLDGMLVIAGFLISLIAMLSITKIDLLTNLSQPGDHNMLWIATGFLFISVHMIYMVVFRAYLGYTPGEWAFDQRCGTDVQQASMTYILKVMLRSFIIVITGFIPTTIISMIMGRDIVGKLVGLQMQMQTYTSPHH